MIFESLRRLDRTAKLSAYRYIGFGSPYFVDFRMAHLELGIDSMINIEHRSGDEDRFRFNQPFGCVELQFGESSDVLESVSWDQRTIIWLDFDKPLDLSQISDLHKVVGNAPAGSVLLITTNAHPDTELDTRVARFRNRLGDYMPFQFDDPALLGGWSTAELYREIINEVLRKGVATRNVGIAAQAAIRYRQWYNFRYADGPRMVTIGGILYDQGVEAQINGLGMEDFEYIRLSTNAYEITLPQLTNREMAHLESRFPCDAIEAGLPFLKTVDIDAYRSLYRYYPHFADVDM